MKRLSFFIFFISLYTIIYSQDSVNEIRTGNEIGFFTNVGICQPIGSHEATKIATPHGKVAYTLGLKYQRPISKKLILETGIGYSKYTIRDHLVIDPYLDDYITETLKTISIPVLLKKYYPGNYFIRFGSMIEFGLPRKGEFMITDAQTGFGLSVGVGKEILIKKFSFDISPNLDLHSVIPFSSHLFQQKLIVFGLKIGLNYNLD